MRALAFGLTAVVLSLILAPLGLALILIPADPPVPEGAAQVTTPFPECEECLRRIDQAERGAGRFESVPNLIDLPPSKSEAFSWGRLSTKSDASINLSIRCRDGVKRSFSFDFEPPGTLKRMRQSWPQGERRPIYPKVPPLPRYEDIVNRAPPAKGGGPSRTQD